ncbi:MAG: 50S ribosomal protein L24, partial [Allorhizobium sp.]
ARRPQVRSVPIRTGDEVTVVRGNYGKRDGKVTTVYRKKFVIHLDRVTRDKANGACFVCGRTRACCPPRRAGQHLGCAP